MRCVIASTQVPFASGGAEALARRLSLALTAAGHEVETLKAPFDYSHAGIARAVSFWDGLEPSAFDGKEIDAVLCLQFPTYYLQHPAKRIWLLHQHRPVYELADRSPDRVTPENWPAAVTNRRIRVRDRETFREATSVRSLSKTVSARLLYYTGAVAEPLYHPPPMASMHYCADSMPFILCPSRLVWHKRQDLLVEALDHVGPDIEVVITGAGPTAGALKRAVESKGIVDRVHFLGHVPPESLATLYANCRAVFFGPKDEDYGYITLEAMLSSKPVITCTDSGGPLEFVQHDVTGWIVDPDPESIGAVVRRVLDKPSIAVAAGQEARRLYDRLIPSWDVVVEELTTWT